MCIFGTEDCEIACIKGEKYAVSCFEGIVIILNVRLSYGQSLEVSIFDLLGAFHDILNIDKLFMAFKFSAFSGREGGGDNIVKCSVLELICSVGGVCCDTADYVEIFIKISGGHTAGFIGFDVSENHLGYPSLKLFLREQYITVFLLSRCFKIYLKQICRDTPL